MIQNCYQVYNKLKQRQCLKQIVLTDVCNVVDVIFDDVVDELVGCVVDIVNDEFDNPYGLIIISYIVTFADSKYPTCRCQSELIQTFSYIPIISF